MEFNLATLDKLSTPKKKKVEGKKKYGNHRVDLKHLLKSKTIRNTKKEKYEEMLGASFENFNREISKYYSGKSKIISDVSDLAELFTNKKFAKALCSVTKNQDDMPVMVFFAIADLMNSNNKALQEEEGLVKKYLKIYVSFNKEKIKKISKILKCKKTKALVLALSAISYKECRMKVMVSRFQSFLNALYNDIDELDEKRVMKVIKECYGKKTNQLLSYILSEKPRSGENFGIVTNAALKMIDRMDNDDRKELLRNYAKNRRRNPNYKRRINLLSINEGDYKKIHRTIERLMDTGFEKELFL